VELREGNPLQIEYGDAGCQILEQLEERNFRDVKRLRIYQKSLLMDQGWETQYKDIDFIISQDKHLPRPEEYSPTFIGDEKLLPRQLLRITENIVEELISYEKIIDEIDSQIEDETPEAEDMYYVGIKQTENPSKPDEVRNTRRATAPIKNDLSSAREDFNDVSSEWETLKKSIKKLPEQTDGSYTQPIEEIYIQENY
jgi:hypothetical protein